MAVGHDGSAPNTKDDFLHGLLEHGVLFPMVKVALVITGTLHVLAFEDELADTVGTGLGKAVGILLQRNGSSLSINGIQLGLDHLV